MITDLFSHKIHSSGEDWPDKLAEIAAIFGEFDGQLYDREAFEARLQKISPRASYLASNGRMDVSKFRDEISAYPAYLGLYFLEQSAYGWIVRLGATTKKFLLREDPDVASFLRLQLPLFQYPNAMGAAYTGSTNRLRLQANTRDRTLEFISKKIHISPVRLISMGLKADTHLRNCSILEAAISYDEIFGLANSPDINKDALPKIEKVISNLQLARAGQLEIPERYESRFHTLKHTEMYDTRNSLIRLRRAVNDADALQLVKRFEAICSIDAQFNAFDHCRNSQEIENVIASGEWGRYFDGVKILPAEIVEILVNDAAFEPGWAAAQGPTSQPGTATAEIYPLKERTGRPAAVKPYDRKREMADPELTKIKRQRRNLAHKELIDKMDGWLRSIGATPKENDHIDLFAKIPNDGSFIFEIKSGGDSLLEQIRKGLSQLYEYQYRYKSLINDDHVSLCLVLPGDPRSIPWITEYLCKDRGINICWFEEDGKLMWPELCSPEMKFLDFQSN
ncbi:MAG: hypothetical protein EYC62_06880 [Alphaproteobacteria bacterium]|nr:MAG: hypothetical protein EYC62_06880 [Alphaproteobacteria bacterium]